MARSEAPRNVIVGQADFDKTVSEARHSGLLGKIEGSWLMKFPNTPIEGAADGLRLLRDQSDVVFGGICTGRRKVLRPWTARQANKVGIAKEEIHYTGSSKNFAPKITRVLESAMAHESKKFSGHVSRVFFIDDNIKGMRESAERLAQDPYYKELMKEYAFTFIAYNPKPGDNLEDLVTTDGTTIMRVVPMENWEPETVDEVLKQLRMN